MSETNVAQSHSDVVDILIADHQEMRMKRFEGVDAADPSFMSRVKELEGKLRYHAPPHPELFDKTIGPGVGMVDRLLDKLRGRHE